MARKDRKKFSFRFVYMFLFSLLVILASLATEGNVAKLPFGAGVFADLLYTLRVIIYTGIMHTARRGLLDYIDLEDVFHKAMQSAEGAGKVFIGVGLFMVSIAICVFAAVKL